MANKLRIVFALIALVVAADWTTAAVKIPGYASPRVRYGVEQLERALREANANDDPIVIRLGADASKKEGFTLSTEPDGTTVVTGTDDSGVLYGCLELARRVREAGEVPRSINFSDAPQMVLRGPCIGMQKTNLLPGHRVYEYPYTPDSFPFFYDKRHWQEFLDFCAANRFNTLYLWNGHPFASLVKLKDYPYAQEVPDEVFARNVEMFRYITKEADRRGIWVVQQFYSIIISKPFAEKNGLPTQLRESTPLVDDYMRKSIAEFVRQYPHVGLMPCLGEALQGQENQNRFLVDVILAGIKDGAQQAGLKEEPPVVIRTHATDLRKAMPEALKVYKNLYTEAKFNGESLTTWEPRGERQKVHLAMSQLGSTHVMNVHILANLEPFRYGAQRFIRKSVQAGRDRLGARGLHLYPLFYWDWPVSPDKGVTLKQWERDWIWFEAWGRYAWNPDIDEKTDHAYWIARLSERYGADAAPNILDAYNDSGECAPRILRRFGITEGNRQTMSLGMYLDQMVSPEKYRAFPELWESQSPPGERLQEYVEREWNKQPHEGETPPQIIAEVLDFSAKAVASIESAASKVTANRDEFARLRNDVHCIRAMSQNYCAKANAAMCMLRYRFSKDIGDMERAASYLAESVEHYRTLTDLTRDTYKFANSMQTSQRKIPTTGGEDGKPANFHWVQILPKYEAELEAFQQLVAALKRGEVVATNDSDVKPLPRAEFKLFGQGVETYDVQPGDRPWTDQPNTIQTIAPELSKLTGIRFPQASNAAIEIEVAEPVQVLIGYFKGGDDKKWRKPPDLETDALAAERGGVEPLILNAVTIAGCPAVDVHAMNFPAGRSKIDVRGGGSGTYVILGLVPQSAKIEKRDAGRKGGS